MGIKLGSLNTIKSIKAGADSVIAKVMAGTVLIWQLVTEVLGNFNLYKKRVELNYGELVDGDTLQTDIDFESQEYLDTIAIYNANGGYTYGNGRIYDVRNYTADVNLIPLSEGLHSNVNDAIDCNIVREGTYNSNAVISLTPNNAGVTSGAYARWQPNLSVNQYTVSFKVRAFGGASFIGFGITATPFSSVPCRFDLNNETFSLGTDAISATIVPEQDGWYNIKIVYDSTNALDYFNFSISDSLSTSVHTYSVGEYVELSEVQIIKGLDPIDFYDPTPNMDLIVTGGGGTRFLSDGSLDKLNYYNAVRNSNDITQWSFTGATGSQSGIESTLTETTSNSEHFTFVSGTGNDFTTGVIRTIEVKKVDARYIYFGSSFNRIERNDIIDLDTRTTTYNYGTGSNLEITELEDGWLKLKSIEYSVSNNHDDFVVGISNGPDNTDKTYTGTGKSVKFRKPQQIIGVEEKPYQVNPNSAQFPKIDYGTGYPAFRVEPQSTNRIPNSNWNNPSNGGTALVSSTDQIGILGQPNTATLLTDNTGGVITASVDAGFTPSSTIKMSLWIKKDNDETRFPRIRFRSATGGVESTKLEVLNTKTGVLLPDGDQTANVLDRGNWWEIVTFHTDTNNTVHSILIYPAWSDNPTTGARNDATTGSVIAGYAGITESTVIDETPIITNGSVVTRTENEISTPLQILPTALGDMTIFYHGKLRGDGLLLSSTVNNNAGCGIKEDDNGFLQTYTYHDSGGAIFSNVKADEDHKVAIVFSNSTNRTALFIDGVLIESKYKNAGATWNRFGTQNGYITRPEKGFGDFKDIRLLPLLTDQEAIDLTNPLRSYMLDYQTRVEANYGQVEDIELLMKEINK